MTTAGATSAAPLNFGATNEMSYDCHSPGLRVHKRRKLAVHGRRLAVGIGQVVEAVEHLDLEHAGKKHAAVATLLAVSLDGRGSGELNVKLNIGILGSRSDRAPARL